MIATPSRMPIIQLPITQPMSNPNPRAIVPRAIAVRVLDGVVSVAISFSRWGDVRANLRMHQGPCMDGVNNNLFTLPDRTQ